MKLLKKIGIGIVALFVVLLIIGFLLPSEVHVEKTQVIDAPIDRVYQNVYDLRNWEKWSPYKKMDPLMEMSYSNPPAGAGAFYNWKSEVPELGDGKLTIAEVVTNKKVVTSVKMEGWGEARGQFNFEPYKDDVKVTWMMDTDLGKNPFNKYGGLFMKSAMKKQFSNGLKALKKVSEGS
jgi:uncharacterized protein YndB with AHSA1/START domain